MPDKLPIELSEEQSQVVARELFEQIKSGIVFGTPLIDILPGVEEVILADTKYTPESRWLIINRLREIISAQE
jgi:hypothetical protein